MEVSLVEWSDFSTLDDPEALTAIPMFRTRDSRSASTGSKFSMIACWDKVSGLAAAASRLEEVNRLARVDNNKKKNKKKSGYRKRSICYSHCRCRRRGITSLVEVLVQHSRPIERDRGGRTESGRRRASLGQEGLRLQTNRSFGQTRNSTVGQPCKRRTPHG